MKSLETERLVLREFREDDFDAVHSYASSEENTVFMTFGPNDEAHRGNGYAVRACRLAAACC